MENPQLPVVLDYLGTPRTDFALLIRGPWGCGKTYFWKNVVTPYLRQKTAWRPLYVSMYGCKSQRDIDTQLFLAAFPQFQNWWIERLSAAGWGTIKVWFKSWFRADLPSVNLRSMVRTTDAVLCFDDLERCPLELSESLGLINTFVEHQGMKTIILCNDEAPGFADTYNQLKDKIVGASLSLLSDFDATILALIDEHRSDTLFRAVVLPETELLKRLFHASESSNIRALRRAISSLSTVVRSLHDAGIEPTLIARELIYLIAPLAFELFGRRADPENVRQTFGEDHLLFTGLRAPREETPAEGSPREYENQVGQRYYRIPLSEWKRARGCQVICEFMISGALDRPGLIRWAEELIAVPDESTARIERLSHGGRELEDDQFTMEIDAVLDEAEHGKWTQVGRYYGVFRTTSWMVDSGVLGVSRTELLEKFVKGLQNAKRRGVLVGEPRLQSLDHPALSPATEEERTLLKLVSEVNQELLDDRARSYFKSLESKRVTDPAEFIEMLWSQAEGGLRMTPVFQHLDPRETVHWLRTLKNSLKAEFSGAIRARYARSVPSIEMRAEIPALEEIYSLLDSKSGAGRRLMSELLLAEIRQAIGEAVNVLTKTE